MTSKHQRFAETIAAEHLRDAERYYAANGDAAVPYEHLTLKVVERYIAEAAQSRPMPTSTAFAASVLAQATVTGQAFLREFPERYANFTSARRYEKVRPPEAAAVVTDAATVDSAVKTLTRSLVQAAPVSIPDRLTFAQAEVLATEHGLCLRKVKAAAHRGIRGGNRYMLTVRDDETPAIGWVTAGYDRILVRAMRSAFRFLAARRSK